MFYSIKHKSNTVYPIINYVEPDEIEESYFHFFICITAVISVIWIGYRCFKFYAEMQMKMATLIKDNEKLNREFKSSLSGKSGESSGSKSGSLSISGLDSNTEIRKVGNMTFITNKARYAETIFSDSNSFFPEMTIGIRNT